MARQSLPRIVERITVGLQLYTIALIGVVFGPISGNAQERKPINEYNPIFEPAEYVPVGLDVLEGYHSHLDDIGMTPDKETLSELEGLCGGAEYKAIVRRSQMTYMLSYRHPSPDCPSAVFTLTETSDPNNEWETRSAFKDYEIDGTADLLLLPNHRTREVTVYNVKQEGLLLFRDGKDPSKAEYSLKGQDFYNKRVGMFLNPDEVLCGQ